MLKKLHFKSWLLLFALIAGSTSVWADNYDFTYNYSALTNMLDGGYSDASSYWKVPDSAENTATIAIPITVQPTSDITITFNIATFGSGTNPSVENTTISALGTETSSNWSGSTVTKYPSSSTFVDGVMTITKPTSPTTLEGLTITIGVNSGVKIFRLKSIRIQYTYEAAPLELKTISEAREQGVGPVYTQGVVTSCVGTTGYIQDATAAICVYGEALTVGDKITVSGTLTDYNGLLEITNPQVNVLTTGNTITPEVMTIASINASELQGWLVRIENATVSAISDKNVTLAQGENTVVVRFSNANDITFGVNDVVSVTGNIGCHTTVQIANPQNVVRVSAAPAINAENVDLTYDATEGEIAYTIADPVTGTTLNATTDAEWISNITVGADKVTFATTGNEGTEARTATITLSYAGAADKTVTVTQAAAPLGDNVIEWDFTKNTPWNFPTDKTVDENEYTDGTYTIKVAGTTGNGFNYYENGKALLLGKNGAYLTFPAFAKDVEKIEVVGSSGASESVKQNIYVEDTAVSEETTGAKDVTNTYFIADNYQNAGRIYTLKVTSAHNTQITKIRIYLKDTVTPIKKDAGLAYETTSFNVNVGEAFTAPTLTNPNSLAVTYTSNNTDLATVDATGAVTLVTGATGTTTITASFAGNETYLPGEASYTLTVVDPDANDGSAEKPYTVAQALAASPANGVYVRGIVSQIDEVSTEYGNATYWISDDGETTTQIMIYRGKFFGGTSFTSADQIKKGDEVVITGNLIVSNDAKQMAQGNYIVSLVHLRGDVNGDGKVTIADVTTLVNIILGKE